MYKEVLRSIESIEIYPVISLVIFFGFFILLLYRVVKTDDHFLHQVSDLPLEGNDKILNDSTTTLNKS